MGADHRLFVSGPPGVRKLAPKRDCAILRDDPAWPASALLMDSDGEVLRRFDEDWDDEQIWAALDFANRAYQMGYQAGRTMKAFEIRQALNEGARE